MDQNASMKALVSTLGVMKASQADFSEQLAEIKKDLSSFRAEMEPQSKNHIQNMCKRPV